MDFGLTSRQADLKRCVRRTAAVKGGNSVVSSLADFTD